MSMIDSPMIEALGRFLDVDVARHKLITSNLANIDTPGFRTRDLDFRAELARAGALAPGRAFGSEGGSLSYASHSSYSSLSYAPVARPVRGLLERPDGNNVSVERESLLLAETQMKYALGVQLVKDQFHEISQAITSGGTTS
jgi:flagellar basal-body rod protein FlgB